jgi:3-methyladenine DNA glycosylase AlkD
VEAPDRQLISAVRTALAAAGDSEKAPQMQAYMKSAMPFYGVQAPRLREICRAVFAERPLADRNTWLSTVRALWRDATHREERYVAIALTGDRRYRPFQTADLVPDLYQELVVTGAWWDYVDEVAIRRIGPILRFQPAEVIPMMRAWAVAPDLWQRRTAIICQIGSKSATDRKLLTHAIDRNADDPDFFIRKAIGWALREHAKIHPEWVREFVARRDGALSGLSKREALKNITT